MAKKEKKKVFSLKGFDQDHYRQTESYVQAIDALYNQAISDYAKLGAGVKVNPSKPFKFSDYPQTKVAAQNIIVQLAGKMEAVISNGSRNQWLYANKKNDEFISSILNTSKIPKKKLAKYQDRNLDALDAFQKRKIRGLDLSQRVWRYTGQLKTTMEMGIDVAVGEGKSAQQLSKDLRKFLMEPDRLFRRVMDKNGKLQLSKNAKAFHPGQGVYRSSYKNAMRLTRSEINMAYRTADQLRWEKLDFIVGIEVRLSNNHTLNGVPFVDICDELKGKYPKGFKFHGWHPQCRCQAFPILLDREEFDKDEFNELKAAIDGTEYKKYESKNKVTDLPQNFKDWIDTNKERAQNWASQPYFIKDNFVGGKIEGGYKFELPTEPVKPVKTEAEKIAIQKAWDERAEKNEAIYKLTKDVQLEAKDFPEITPEMLSVLQNPKNLLTLKDSAMKLKAEIEAIRKEEERLSTLLVGVKGLKAQFGNKAVQDLFTAVEAKTKTWDNLTTQELYKKLEFEIDYVEKYKKYPTWKGAQDAYLKQFAEVQYKIQIEEVKSSLAYVLDYAKNTKSPKVKALADELNALILGNSSIAKINIKAAELNKKVYKLIKDNTARRSGKGIAIDKNDPDKFSQKRKDAAVWAKSARESDEKLRDVAGTAWRSATNDQKDAAFKYTSGSSYINEPLRGITYVGQYLGKYNGVKDATSLANLIERSSYKMDIWLQRGVDRNGFRGVFGEDIASMTLSQARSELLGKTGTEMGFSSCGSSKGTGFSSKEIVYNIYCPSGTKMIYAEPFSHYGEGSKRLWDGISKQSSFGSESEVIIQKETLFRITKIDLKGSKWYVDVEVVGQ